MGGGCTMGGGPDDSGRAHGLVVDHVLTRTVRDCAATLDWTGRPEDCSPYSAPPCERPFLRELSTPPGSCNAPRGAENKVKRADGRKIPSQAAFYQVWEVARQTYR